MWMSGNGQAPDYWVPITQSQQRVTLPVLQRHGRVQLELVGAPPAQLRITALKVDRERSSQEATRTTTDAIGPSVLSTPLDQTLTPLPEVGLRLWLPVVRR